MDNIEMSTRPVDKLLEKYKISEERYKSRYEALYKDIDAYLKASDFKSEQVQLNKNSLNCMLLDYFIDIGRLKEFHKIEHVNSIKIVSYISYWFLKRKPIQVLSYDDNLLYINEKFIVIYILNFLMSRKNGNLLDRQEKGLITFRDQLYYYLKYRHINPQFIEMFLISFFAGQIYQNTDYDLSDKLPESENRLDLKN